MHKLPSQPDPDLCALCHQQGHGCCQASAEGQAQMFGLTQGEVALISQASGLEPEEFCLTDQAEPWFLEFLASIHPVFLQTMPGGRRLRLRLDDDYRCVFLSATGCRLPTPARPLYCRLYPFWVNPYDRLMVLTSPTCLAQKDARSWREVLKRLGQDEEELRRLFARLSELASQHKP